MKRLIMLIAVMLMLSPVVCASTEDKIVNELELERATDMVPDTLRESTGIDFSPTGTPAENGMSLSAVFKTALNYILDALGEELPFAVVMIALLIFSAVLYSFADSSSNVATATVVRFAVSGTVSAVLISHIQNAFSRAEIYVEELAVFMSGMLPFMGSISVIGGELSTAAVQKATLVTAVTILQRVVGEITVPVCSTVLAMAVAGYVSSVALGSLSELISSVAVKVMTVCCGIMCAILYFQNTVTAVTDSLALRSVKLAAGNFIPVVGSFVSEASGTLISGVGLVRSTFGVFAICVLMYLAGRPIVNFLIVKLCMRFVGSVAALLGCDREQRAIKEISSVYNVLSAAMIVSACFFIFAFAVFIKSEVG